MTSKRLKLDICIRLAGHQPTAEVFCIQNRNEIKLEYVYLSGFGWFLLVEAYMGWVTLTPWLNVAFCECFKEKKYTRSRPLSHKSINRTSRYSFFSDNIILWIIIDIKKAFNIKLSTYILVTGSYN